MDFAELNRRLLETFALVGEQIVLPQIPSRTLQAALQLIIDEPEMEARLFIPHYWAVYLHDGREGFSAPAGKSLIFYANPEDDPRIAGTTSPERASATRHLSRKEYEDGLERNALHHELGEKPFMYVLKSVGPAAGNPFFERGLDSLASSAEDEVFRELDNFVQRTIDDENLHDRFTAEL